MMTTIEIADGHYLQDNRTSLSQYRKGRRATVRPVCVVHTAENATAFDPTRPTGGALAIAKYFASTDRFASYHEIGDPWQIVPLVDRGNEAFHCRGGYNRWTTSVSLAMRAGDWGRLPPAMVDLYVAVLVAMMARTAVWYAAHGHLVPAATLLTKAEVDQPGASGFTTHARLDPTRRSDPGAVPWDRVLADYADAIGVPSTGGGTLPTSDEFAQITTGVQQSLVNLGFDLGAFGPNGDGVDGDWGQKTTAALQQAFSELAWFKQNAGASQADERKARLWDQLAGSVKALMGG